MNAQDDPVAVINSVDWPKFASQVAQQQDNEVIQAALHFSGSPFGLHHPQFESDDRLISPRSTLCCHTGTGCFLVTPQIIREKDYVE